MDNSVAGIGLLGIAFPWLIISFVIGVAAQDRGLSFLGFFLLSLFLTPLTGIAVALIKPPNQEVLDRRKRETGKERKCPKCGENIKIAAVVCRHCTSDLTEIIEQEKSQIKKVILENEALKDVLSRLNMKGPELTERLKVYWGYNTLDMARKKFAAGTS